MGKSSASSIQTVKPEAGSLIVCEPERVQKGMVIEKYLTKYALFENKTVTDELLEAYLEALEHFELRQIEKGMKRYLREGTRWPWPGMLGEYIEEEI